MKEGIVLFAHGSRDPEWARPFERISQELARRLPQAVVCSAYLEQMRPTFDEAVATFRSLVDGGLQEDPIPSEVKARLRVPRLTTATPPQGDSGAVAEAARLLVNAQNPVIVADRLARTPAGIQRLVELAEALQAPVIDQHGRMNFPSSHPLNQSESSGPLIAQADVILGLELFDFWGTVSAFRDSLHRSSRSRIKPGTRLISITASDLFSKSNFQDFQRYPEVDVAMAADAEATLPALTEAVRRLVTDDRRRAFQERRARFEQAHARERAAAREEAAVAWDASPISTAVGCT